MSIQEAITLVDNLCGQMNLKRDGHLRVGLAIRVIKEHTEKTMSLKNIKEPLMTVDLVSLN